MLFGGYKGVYPFIVPSIVPLSYVVDSEGYYNLFSSLLFFEFFIFLGVIRGILSPYTEEDAFSSSVVFLYLFFGFLSFGGL